MVVTAAKMSIVYFWEEFWRSLTAGVASSDVHLRTAHDTVAMVVWQFLPEFHGQNHC